MPDERSIAPASAGRYGSLEERFWPRVDKNGPNGCWLWTGAKRWLGYGTIRRNGKNDSAHRIAYELIVGPIPEGLELDHLCRVPACVNPAHLEPVTHQENLRRSHGYIGEKARQTHCIHGHPLTGEDVYVRPGDGHRQCRACNRERARAWRARQKTGHTET